MTQDRDPVELSDTLTLLALLRDHADATADPDDIGDANAAYAAFAHLNPEVARIVESLIAHTHVPSALAFRLTRHVLDIAAGLEHDSTESGQFAAECRVIAKAWRACEVDHSEEHVRAFRLAEKLSISFIDQHPRQREWLQYHIGKGETAAAFEELATLA
jgi:hypothetical protein